jgi:hypothetical protein
MKSKIIFTLTFIFLSCTTNFLLAQDAVAKTAGYDLKKNVKCRVMATPDGCSVVFDNAVVPQKEVNGGMVTGKRQYQPLIIRKEYRISSGDNSMAEISSPRDMATGQASGRMQTAVSEVVVTKASSDASAGMGAGKVSVQDLHFVINSGGNKREITCTNGECDFPSDLPNGKCTAIASWSWGMSQSGGTSSSGMSGGKAAPKSCEVSFLIDIKDGSYMAINEKGLPGEKKPAKTKAATTTK